MSANLNDYDREICLTDGLRLRLRPVRPEDEGGLQDLVERMSPEDVRLRFNVSKEALSDTVAGDLAKPDRQREMAFVLASADPHGDGELLGAVRIITGASGTHGEYAVMVRSDMQGRGLGRQLMENIIEYSRTREITEIVGEVLRENASMLRLCKDLGFAQQTSPNDPAVIEVRLEL